MPHAITAHDLYDRAQRLQATILRGRSAQVAADPVQAWAAVCRACAAAEHVHRAECRRRASARPGEAYAMTRQELAFLNNLDRIWQPAKAQVAALTAHLPPIG